MGNTKKASKKRLLRRKIKKQNTKQDGKQQSNANPASGMSRLEYQQALMDPRFRAAMVGFNGSIGMGSQQSAQLRELEQKSNEIMRNINFQEKKAALTQDIEEKKKEQRRLDDDYEMKRITDKHNKEVEAVESKIRRTQRESKHHDLIDPLNDQLKGLKDEYDTKQQERKYMNEKYKLEHEVNTRTRMRQLEDELDELKEQKDNAESQYEQTRLERQYRDKRKQYEQEKVRLLATLDYNYNDEYRKRELQAAIEMDKAEKELDAIKYLSELKDKTEQAKRSTHQNLIKVLGKNFKENDNEANNKNLHDMHTKLIKDNHTLNLINEDIKRVQEAYDEKTKAEHDLDKALIKFEALKDYKPDSEFTDSIKVLRQGILAKKQQNEDIKRIRGEMKATMNNNNNEFWAAQKTFEEFMTKNPNAQPIAKRIAYEKRGNTDIKFEDWNDIVKAFNESNLKVRDAIINPNNKFSEEPVQQSYNRFIEIAKHYGLNPDEIRTKYRDDAVDVNKLKTELQSRTIQAESAERGKAYYADKIASIYSWLPQNAKLSFLGQHFPMYADRKQVVLDALDFNPNASKAITSEYEYYDTGTNNNDTLTTVEDLIKHADKFANNNNTFK